MIRYIRAARRNRAGYEAQPQVTHHGFGGQFFSQTHHVIRAVSRDTRPIVIPSAGNYPVEED